MTATPITIRPIRPEDELALVAFHQTLSDRSVALRYSRALPLSERVRHERLQRIAVADYDREMPLVATAGKQIIAVAQLSRVRGGIAAPGGDRNARFHLLIRDASQNQGLGMALLERLLDVARAEGIHRITADILAENMPMQRICEKLGFTLTEPHDQPPVVTATYALS